MNALFILALDSLTCLSDVCSFLLALVLFALRNVLSVKQPI